MGPIYVALYWEDLNETAKERVNEKLGYSSDEWDPYFPIAYIERDVRKRKWDIPDAGNIHTIKEK